MFHIITHCVFCSHHLTVAGKLVSLVTDNNAVDTFIVYCMRQMSNSLSSAGCDTGCNEELLLTSMLSVLKVETIKYSIIV